MIAAIVENRGNWHGKSLLQHRDFNNYPVWVGGAGESGIEDGKSGETVGAVRNVLYQGRRIRQRLLAQSDVERCKPMNSAARPRCR
jgi:hypothetical protein